MLQFGGALGRKIPTLSDKEVNAISQVNIRYLNVAVGLNGIATRMCKQIAFRMRHCV